MYRVRNVRLREPRERSVVELVAGEAVEEVVEEVVDEVVKFVGSEIEGDGGLAPKRKKKR